MHRVLRSQPVDALDLDHLEALLFSRCLRVVLGLAGHVGHAGAGVAGQRQADEHAEQDRDPRSGSSGAAALRFLDPRGPPRPPPRRRRHDRRQRRERLGALAGAAPGSRCGRIERGDEGSASGKRCAGSFSSARITTASRAGETAGLIALGRCGSCETCFSATATALSPSNGTRPVSALVEDDPDRVEIGGGGHLQALGLLGREVVGGAHDRAGLGDLRDPGPGDPEVGDRGQPSASTITLWGLRSRWMTPWRWAKPAASRIWPHDEIDCGGVRPA